MAAWMTHKAVCTVFLSKELVVKRKEHGEDAAEVGDASIEFGIIFSDQGRFVDAERSLLEAERITRLITRLVDGRETVLTAVLHNLRVVYERQGRYVQMVYIVSSFIMCSSACLPRRHLQCCP
jgi:hypothetical protein